MADYALMGGLAQGLQQGLLAYQQERARQDDMRQKTLAQALQAKAAGLQMNKQGTGWDYTPEALEERNFKKQEREAGLLKTMAETGKLNRSGTDSTDDLLKQALLRERLEKIRTENENREREKTSGETAFKSLPKDKQILVDQYTKQAADYQKQANTFDEIIGQLDDPNISNDQKQAILQEQLKLLNSMISPDALGASEVGRVGPYLDWKPDPFGPKGMSLGANVPKAIEQYKNARSRVGGGLEKTKGQIDELFGRKKGLLSPRKIKVSNGKETLEIDPSDLGAAQKDGFKQL